MQSGGKTVISVKRVSIVAIMLMAFLTIGMAWFNSVDSRASYYQQTNQVHGDKRPVGASTSRRISAAVESLFNNGKRKMEHDKRVEKEKTKTRVAVQYFAPQVIGQGGGQTQTLKTGTKLIGFLLNSIDSRTPSLVRVKLPRGGESSGVEIEKDSTLFGQFSYAGSSDKVFITFSQCNTPDGGTRKIQAQALDSSDYTPGIRGEVRSQNGIKIASRLGLAMFSGMADVLTEKESLGWSDRGVQAKPTMKNGLLQGLSRAAQDQSNQTASEIDAVKDYIFVPEGKEMIIELTEEYQK